MRIEVNIEKKYAFAVVVALLVLSGFWFVIAYGGNQPAIVGHTLGEIAPPTGCGVGEVLGWTGSAWDCVSDNVNVENVTRIVAGTGITITPISGLGIVTIGANVVMPQTQVCGWVSSNCPAGQQCMFGMNIGCNPSLDTCSQGSNIQSCGNNPSWKYCCLMS